MSMNFNITKNENVNLLPLCEAGSTESFGVNNLCFLRNNKPWLPVMAEFHFSRYDENEWELELNKIKACGVNIVSTYLFWIHHEEIKGEFNFKGNRNIRKFLELCKKLNLYAFVRIGPWCHGECRNGGFPDWLIESKVPLRSLDKEFLALTDKLYKAYANEIVPMLFSKGGCVIGVQIENEFCESEEYLDTLLKMAKNNGFNVPYYTVTGWGPHITYFPENRVLPIFGGYPDAPWEQHTRTMPVNTHYFFTPLKNDSTIGNDQISGAPSEVETGLENYPFLTCELGAGVECTYHRRPIISAMDGYAISLVKLGCGNNMPGYYVFHGGFNPVGNFYQESKLSNYPNDLPVSSYDFQAPIGEYGLIRDSYFYLRRLHLFANYFGSTLADMKAFFPKEMPKGKEDFSTPRLSVRTDGEKSYLFFNTYQRHYPLSEIKNLDININFESGKSIIIKSFNAPSDKCGVFPIKENYFGYDFGFTSLQPLFKGKVGDIDTVVFFAIDGIKPELRLKSKVNIESKSTFTKEYENNETLITDFSPNFGCRFLLDRKLRIIILNESESLNFTSLNINNENYLILSDNNSIAFNEDNLIKIFSEASFNASSLPQIENLPGKVEIPIPDINLISLKETENKITEENLYTYYLYDAPSNCPEYILKLDNSLLSCEDFVIYFETNANVTEVFADNELIADDFLKDNSFKLSLKRLKPYLKENKEIGIKCSEIKTTDDIYFESERTKGKLYFKVKSLKAIKTHCFEVKKR